MYFETHAQFTKMLKNLGAILDKAKAYAETRKFDPNNFLSARLAPDMYPLTRQVQSACDSAKFTSARLAGKEAPAHPDTEQTFAELRERVNKCVAFLETFKPEHFHGAAERHVTMPWLEGKYVLGKDYLLEMATPNFYFHLTAAYAILRHNGVEIGKMDFLGSFQMHDR